jgi:hypothetical protein
MYNVGGRESSQRLLLCSGVVIFIDTFLLSFWGFLCYGSNHSFCLPRFMANVAFIDILSTRQVDSYQETLLLANALLRDWNSTARVQTSQSRSLASNATNSDYVPDTQSTKAVRLSYQRKRSDNDSHLHVCLFVCFN